MDVLREAVPRLLGTVRCIPSGDSQVAYPEAHELVLGWYGVPLEQRRQFAS